MKLKVKVIANAKKDLVQEIEPGFLRVKLTAVPEKGKANQQLVQVLAKYFKLKPQQVRIKKGFTSQLKLIELD